MVAVYVYIYIVRFVYCIATDLTYHLTGVGEKTQFCFFKQWEWFVLYDT